MGTSSDRSSAQALLKLPHDITRQILNDVSLYRILAMAACLGHTEPGKRFKEILLSLPQRTFFPNEKHLIYMIDLYKFYYEVLQSTVGNTKKLCHPRESPLAMTISGAPLDNELRWQDERLAQQNWLFCQVHLMLKSFGWWGRARLPWLDEYPPKYPDSDLYYRYEEYWDAMKNEHFRFATKRMSQIEKLAGIFRKYPTYLKTSSDPGFEARLNHAHIVSHWESIAKKYEKDILFKHYVRRESDLYRNDRLPIIPLDRDLLLFVHTLARYPYDCSCYNYSKVESLGVADLSINSEPPSKPLVYPSDIKDEIDRVVHGLAFFYTLKNSIPDIPRWPERRKLLKRTRFTVYPATPDSKWPAIPTCESCAG